MIESPSYSPSFPPFSSSSSLGSRSSISNSEIDYFGPFASESILVESPPSSTHSTPKLDSPEVGKRATPLPLFSPHYSLDGSAPRVVVREPLSPTTPSGGGATMQRSFSMPVETQRQLEDRLSIRTKMQRAMSTHASVPVVATRSPAVKTKAQGLGVSMSNVHLPFGEGWGSSLPVVEVQVEQTSTFPYNVTSRFAPLPPKIPRSHSTTDIPTHHSPVTYISTSSASSSGVVGRPRKASRLGPMTPIEPVRSPEWLTVDSSLATRAKLQRGKSF